MFVFLPYGNEGGPIRFPWITASVLAVCLLVHLFAWYRDRDRERWVAELQERQEKLEAIERLAGKHLQGLDQVLREANIVAKDDQTITSAVKDALAKVKAEKAAVQAEMIISRYGLVPGRSGPWWTFVTHAFLHAGWFHLIGNLLFLWIAASNLEHRFGVPRLIGLYAGGIVGAALFYTLWHPDSMEPAVGASGAVSAMIGAFLVALHSVKLRIFWFAMLFVVPRWGVFSMPAWAAIPFWLAAQLAGAGMEASVSMGVAFSAHLGGFAVGLVLASVFVVFGGDDDAEAWSGPSPARRPAGPSLAPAKPGVARAGQPAPAIGQPQGSPPAQAPSPQPRFSLESFLQRFPVAEQPAKRHRLEAFLAWRKGRPGHMLTEAHVTMYLGSLPQGEVSPDEIRPLLKAFIEQATASRGQRFQTMPAGSTPTQAAGPSIVARVIGGGLLLGFLGLGGHCWGRFSASRDCSRLKDAIGERRDALLEDTKTKDEIVARVRDVAAEWEIAPGPGGVGVDLEPLDFVTLSKLPSDEMFALGIGVGPNPNKVFTVRVDAPVPRFLATGQCRFERSMRVIVMDEDVPVTDAPGIPGLDPSKPKLPGRP